MAVDGGRGIEALESGSDALSAGSPFGERTFTEAHDAAFPTAPAAVRDDERVEVDAHGRWWRDALRRRMLAVADVISGLVAGFIAIGFTGDWPWAFAAIPIWLVLAKIARLYDRDHVAIRHHTIDEATTLIAWTAASTALLIAIVPPIGIINPGRAAVAWIAATAAAVVLRGAARALWRRMVPPEVTLVVGGGELAASIRRKLELFPDIHLRLAGHDDLAAINGHDPVEHLVAIAPRVDRLIVASDRLDTKPLAQLVARCRELQVKLNVVSPLRGRAAPAPTVSRVADLRLYEYDTSDISRSTRMVKRVMDVCVSGAGLLLALPFLPLVALAIKLDSRGPVFFFQVRAGQGGRAFRMVKLRTMSVDAEDRLSDLVQFEHLVDPVFKLNEDPRVTPVGRWLRRISLDELPQLWNVLKGEMSIVGPRPEDINLVRRYRPEHRFRLNVKPGMTGPMQVYGRGELSFPERLAVELDYVENLSVTRDLHILAQTLPAITRGTGAF